VGDKNSLIAGFSPIDGSSGRAPKLQIMLFARPAIIFQASQASRVTNG
jgi:hypothetical protein